MTYKTTIFFIFYSLLVCALFAQTRTVNFGTISGEEPYYHTFYYNNTGKQPVEITKAVVSCPCVQVLSYPRVIKANEKGSINVRMYASGKGSVKQNVMLELQGAEITTDNNLVSLELTGTVKGEHEFNEMTIDSVQIPFSLITKKMTGYEDSLYRPSQVVKKGGKNLYLVNVSEQVGYVINTEINAISMPLYQVKTRGFLRSFELAIAGKGYDNETLEDEVSRLNGMGFKAFIVSGGIQGLLFDTGRITPAPFNYINAQSYYMLRNNDRWTVVNVSDEIVDDVQYLMPASKHVFAGDDKLIFIDHLEKELKEMGKTDRKILIVNKNGHAYPVVDRVPDGMSIFFLAGGLDMYKQVIRNNALALLDNDSKVIRHTKCGSCQ